MSHKSRNWFKEPNKETQLSTTLITSGPKIEEIIEIYHCCNNAPRRSILEPKDSGSDQIASSPFDTAHSIFYPRTSLTPARSPAVRQIFFSSTASRNFEFLRLRHRRWTQAETLRASLGIVRGHEWAEMVLINQVYGYPALRFRLEAAW